jgi:hypothetical protein
MDSILKMVQLKNTNDCKYNIDWEDITKDKDGNLYVGDFGNDNERKDLCIYKIDKKSLTTKAPFQPTKFFAYPEQKIFLLKKQKCFMMLKDFSNSKIISISLQKNRSKGFEPLFI